MKVALEVNDLDTLIILGSRVTDSTPYRPIKRAIAHLSPFFETLMRYWAAQLLYERRITKRFLIIGGHAIGVRYSIDPGVPDYARPNFSFDNIRMAQNFISEAYAIRNALVENGVSEEAIAIEETALTTEEAVRIAGILYDRYRIVKHDMLLRGVFFGEKFPHHIAFLTNFYALERTTEAVNRISWTDGRAEVLCAEDILGEFADLLGNWIERIMNFYNLNQWISDTQRRDLEHRLRAIQPLT